MKLVACVLYVLLFGALSAAAQTKLQDGQILTLDQVRRLHLPVVGICSSSPVIVAARDRKSVGDAWGLQPIDYRGKKMEFRCVYRYVAHGFGGASAAERRAWLFVDGREMPQSAVAKRIRCQDGTEWTAGDRNPCPNDDPTKSTTPWR